jgi:hypothetical protein
MAPATGDAKVDANKISGALSVGDQIQRDEVTGWRVVALGRLFAIFPMARRQINPQMRKWNCGTKGEARVLKPLCPQGIAAQI